MNEVRVVEGLRYLACRWAEEHQGSSLVTFQTDMPPAS